MNNEKEEQILKKRFLDLARAAEYKGICTYTDFLGLNESSIFFRMKNELPNVKYDFFGGYTGAERKILCFYGEKSVKAFSDCITCIRIQPLNRKFSDDLNHRDFLGALIECSIMDKDMPDIEPEFREIRGSVSSPRLDSVIALAFSSSRSSILGLISGGKVFVDGKLVESNSYMLKEDETVSVRGFGKFIYKGMQNQTKKGRYFVILSKYI